MPPTLILAYLLVLIGLVAANAIATLRIAGCEISTRRQKFGQFAIVWLVPFIGAAITLLLTRKAIEKGLGRYSPKTEEPEDLDVSKADYGGADGHD